MEDAGCAERECVGGGAGWGTFFLAACEAVVEAGGGVPVVLVVTERWRWWWFLLEDSLVGDVCREFGGRLLLWEGGCCLSGVGGRCGRCGR